MCRSFDHMVGMYYYDPSSSTLASLSISSLVGGPLGNYNGAKVQYPCLFPDRELTNLLFGPGTHAGYLKSLNPEVDGVTGRETCPNDPLKPREGSTKVLSLSSFCRSASHRHCHVVVVSLLYAVITRALQVSDDAPYVALVDPSHSYAATKKQCFGYGPVKAPAPMTGFVRNYAENDDFVVGADIMSCFNPKTRMCVR